MSDFTAPNDASIYTSRVFERSFELINSNIWSGIEIYKLQQWISNFETELEKYFAACILDNFIYRSDPQTYSLIFQIFTRNLPDLFRRFIYYEFEEPCLERLRSDPFRDEDPSIRIVLAVQETDPPTKSAYTIGRYLKRRFDIEERWIIKPTEIEDCYKKGVKYFIFMDDFVGTGHQFLEVCDSCSLRRFSDVYFIYTPFIAHESGVNNIKENYPNVSISPAEILRNGTGVFENNSICFKDEINTPKQAKKFYHKLINKYRIGDKKRRGYGNLELAIAFQHAAPDNSLKIIWYNENGWNSLVDR